METFLPSEVARLVLGYLKDENCVETSQVFMRECTHLSEYIGMLHLGREFSTEVLGKSLKMILDEYGNFQLSKKVQVSSVGLSNLWDRYEMLGCQLRHAASSPHANQSLPVAGKQTADSIRSYSHKQASRNRCRYAAGNRSAVVQSDVSIVLTATNASSQSSAVAAAPGVYYLVSAVSSSPCVAILPENRNPMAASTGVQVATTNHTNLRTASIDVLNDAGDGRESSCFGDDLESLASGDGAPSGFQSALVENDGRMIDAVAAGENGVMLEAVLGIQKVPLSQNLSPLRSRGAVNSGDLYGSPACRLSTSCGSTVLQIDTSYASTPKTTKSRRQKRVAASPVTKTPTETPEPKSVGHYHLRSSALASKLPSTSERPLKQSAKSSPKKPCSSSCADPAATRVAASTPCSYSNSFPNNRASAFSDSAPPLCQRDPTAFSETVKMKQLDFLSPVKSVAAKSDSLTVTGQEAKGGLPNEKLAVSEHSKSGTPPKPSRTAGNSRTEACSASAETRSQLPLKSFHRFSRDRRKKAQPYKKKVSLEQASYLVPGGGGGAVTTSAQQHQSVGACASESAVGGDLGLDADMSQLLERLIKSQKFAEQMAKDINDRKLSKEDSDKRTSTVAESLGSGRGKSEIGSTEPVRRGLDDGGFISDGVVDDDRGSAAAVGVDSTSEVVPDGKRTGDADAGSIHGQRLSEDGSHEASASLSMLDIDLMTDAAIDNILKELCNDPTLDSIANGVYSSNHDNPINRPNPDLSRNSIHDDGSGQLEFSHDFSDFLAQHSKLEPDARPAPSRSEPEELPVTTSTMNSSPPVFPNQSSTTGELPPSETGAIATETRRQYIRVFIPGYGVVPDQIDILEVIGSGVEVDDDQSSNTGVTRAAPEGAEMDAEQGGGDVHGSAHPAEEERVIEEPTLGISPAEATVPDCGATVSALENSDADVQKNERSLKSEPDCLVASSGVPVSQPENVKTSTKNLEAVNAEKVVPRRIVPKFICSTTSKITSFSQLPCDSITSNPGHVTCQAKRPPLEAMLDEIGGLVKAVEHSEEKALLTAVKKDSSMLEADEQLTNPSPNLTEKSIRPTDSSSSIIIFSSPSPTSRSAPGTEAKAGGGTAKRLPKDKHRRGMLAKQCRILGRNRVRPKDASCGLSRLANVENADDSKRRPSKSIIRFSEPSPIIDLTNTTNSSETSGDRFRIDVDAADCSSENGSRTKSEEQEQNLPINPRNNTCVSATNSKSNCVSVATTVKDIDNRSKALPTIATSSNLNGVVEVAGPNHSDILPDLTDSDSDLNVSSGFDKSSGRIKTFQLGVKDLKDETKKKGSRSKKDIEKKEKEGRRKARVRHAARNAAVDDDVIDVGTAVVDSSFSKSKKSKRKKSSKKSDRKKAHRDKMLSDDTGKKSSQTKHKKNDASTGITNEDSPTNLRQYLERNLFKAKQGGVALPEPDYPQKSEASHNRDFQLRIKFSKKKSRNPVRNALPSKNGAINVCKGKKKDDILASLSGGSLVESPASIVPGVSRLSGGKAPVQSNCSSSSSAAQPGSLQSASVFKGRRSNEISPNLSASVASESGKNTVLSADENQEVLGSHASSILPKNSARAFYASSVKASDKKDGRKRSKKEGSKEKKKLLTPSEGGQVFSLSSVTLLDRAQKVRQPSDSRISCDTLLSMPSSFDCLLMSSARCGMSVDDGVNENQLSDGCPVPRSCTDIAMPDKQDSGDQLSPDVRPNVTPGSGRPQGQLSEEETAVNALLLLADDMAAKSNGCKGNRTSVHLSDNLILKDAMPRSAENSLDDMLYDYVATGCSDVVLDLSRKKCDASKDDAIDFGARLCENSRADVVPACENTPDDLRDSVQHTDSTSNIDLNEAAKRLDLDRAAEKSTMSVFCSPNLGIVLRIDEEAMKSPSTPSTSDCVPDENSSSFCRKRARSPSSQGHPKRVSRKRFQAMNIESFLSQVHP